MSVRSIIKRCALSELTTNLFLPAAAVIPPILMAGVLAPGTPPEWLFDNLRGFFKAHPTMAVICTFWTAFLVPVAYGLTKLRAYLHGNEHLRETELVLLLRALDNPVGKKSKRFGKVASELIKNGTESRGNVFQRITQPDEQIALLIENLHVFLFNELDSPDDLNVTLAKMDRSKVERFEVFLPHGIGPRSSPEDLQSPDCCFNRATGNRIITLEAQLAPSRRYAMPALISSEVKSAGPGLRRASS